MRGGKVEILFVNSYRKIFFQKYLFKKARNLSDYGYHGDKVLKRKDFISFGGNVR
tara:strand:- start:9 stop:173 length:165 start_codon:yes stop_codon:yes gene_type:complete